ncbi:hypothetical protein [Algoriphagus sp. NG3]|uniref:hypothetical protein n=1 Tax=Algoriphagus sp. NG3 TaxID=3097546 RepID=UPI002A7ED4F8|nr:hypothetical protein [Algoriphagus sp. NG3]WPR77533.1 hypothetical protein SLW71_09255 [Algoriphagus sp. NG3]
MNMKFFYLSSNPDFNGKLLIHERSCPELPSPYERDYLGAFNSAFEALKNATEIKSNVSICPVCGCKEEIYTLRHLSKKASE